MFQFNDPGLQNLVRKFLEECELLSNIDHPNIVKYLGTTQDPRSRRPILLMELMHESVTRFLERSTGLLPYYSQFRISHDVACALAYLHSKSIVHRDLSSNNILLTADGTAKVTDFGMSKLIEMHPQATPLTQCPGTLVYMPPEALIMPPQYSDKLDCFSYGVLTVQIATKQFPDPGSANTFVEDPKYPTGRVIVPIPEVERRRKHIDLVDPTHPLLSLAIKCLEDRDTDRPSARVLCEQLAPLVEEERLKKEQEEKEKQIKKEMEERERQREREREEKLRLRQKELEKEAKREEKELEKEAKREAQQHRKEAKAAKEEASKKKPRRFVDARFNLDLTYIKHNIVAMAFPCVKLESLFRNDISDVIRFFDTKHTDRYKVYNLCSERLTLYEPARFHKRVATYPFDEDEPPPFELIKPFCDDVDSWLKADDRNVAAVHCKDGLGRTGVMVSAYCLHDKIFDTAADALQFYSEARTENAKGVTIPSQRRYVQYYGHLMRNTLDYSPKTYMLKGIRLTSPGNLKSLRFTLYLYKTRIYTSRVFKDTKKTDPYAEIELPRPMPMCGDMKIVFYNGRRKMFHFWFNTFFLHCHAMQQAVEGKSSPLATEPSAKVLILDAAELDAVTKYLPPNFQVHVVYREVTVADSPITTHEDSDFSDSDDYDLSDTDNEDEWQTLPQAV